MLYLLKILDIILNIAEIPLHELVSVATNQAPEMIEKNTSLIQLIKSDGYHLDFFLFTL